MPKTVKIITYVLPVVLLMFVPYFMVVGVQSSKEDADIQHTADLVYQIVQANRTAYAQVAGDQSGEGGNNAEQTQIPAHLFTGNSAAINGAADMHYSVQSLWAINQNNFPQSDKEREGLIYVLKNPGKNYYTTLESNGVKYFLAVYPDHAIYPTCVNCHNGHEESPKRDFQVGDLMGGVVVRIPL